MTDTAANATPAAAEKKPETIAEGMDARRVFVTVEDASAYLNSLGDKFPDFGTQTFAMVGVDSDGNFDPEVYPDGMLVMVAALKNRGAVVGGTRQPSTLKAIVVAPIPSLDSLMVDAAGSDWVNKIIQKELNHVAVRALRDADNIAAVIGEIPTTREAYITSSRDAGGGIMEAFNELYKGINATLSAKVKSWEKARLTKSDLKKALESTAFAAEYYPALEDRGEGKESLFVQAAKIGQLAAKRKGLDPTIFERWIATRDAATFDAGADEDDLDIDALSESIGVEAPAPVEGEPAPAATE